MRSLSLLSLVVVLLIVGLLIKKQFSPEPSLTSAASAASDAVVVPDVSSPQQARHVPQQVQNDVNQMMHNRSEQLEQELDKTQP